MSVCQKKYISKATSSNWYSKASNSVVLNAPLFKSFIKYLTKYFTVNRIQRKDNSIVWDNTFMSSKQQKQLDETKLMIGQDTGISCVIFH
jgi:hypothetical protein